MVRENSLGLTVAHTRVSSKKIIFKEKESIIGQMVVNTMDNG